MIDRSEKIDRVERTANGVAIQDELRVWTNDLETGWIDLGDAGYETNQNTGEKTLWFRVRLDRDPNGRGVLQSSDRVSTVNPFTRQEA